MRGGKGKSGNLGRSIDDLLTEINGNGYSQLQSSDKWMDNVLSHSSNNIEPQDVEDVSKEMKGLGEDAFEDKIYYLQDLYDQQSSKFLAAYHHPEQEIREMAGIVMTKEEVSKALSDDSDVISQHGDVTYDVKYCYPPGWKRNEDGSIDASINVFARVPESFVYDPDNCNIENMEKYIGLTKGEIIRVANFNMLDKSDEVEDELTGYLNDIKGELSTSSKNCELRAISEMKHEWYREDMFDLAASVAPFVADELSDIQDIHGYAHGDRKISPEDSEKLRKAVDGAIDSSPALQKKMRDYAKGVLVKFIEEGESDGELVNRDDGGVATKVEFNKWGAQVPDMERIVSALKRNRVDFNEGMRRIDGASTVDEVFHHATHSLPGIGAPPWMMRDHYADEFYKEVAKQVI